MTTSPSREHKTMQKLIPFVGCSSIVFVLLGVSAVFASGNWLTASYFWMMALVCLGVWITQRKK